MISLKKIFLLIFSFALFVLVAVKFSHINAQIPIVSVLDIYVTNSGDAPVTFKVTVQDASESYVVGGSTRWEPTELLPYANNYRISYSWLDYNGPYKITYDAYKDYPADPRDSWNCRDPVAIPEVTGRGLFGEFNLEANISFACWVPVAAYTPPSS